MAYSKRWELMHILGGGCVQCGNQNFGELEIDHKYNDEHVDRDLYTNLEARYVANPRRARERLQLLCKPCHKQKHSAPVKPRDVKHNKMRILMATLTEQEGHLRLPVKEQTLIQILVEEHNFENREARDYIRLMLREASIYESIPGGYNKV